MTSKRNIIYIKSLFILYIVINFQSCNYSFTGASVPSHIKSIAIPYFQDRSGSGEPELRETFTNELIQKFIDDNTLQVAEKVNADAIVECNILSLSDAPAVVAGGEDVSSRRINLTVKVTYRDLVKKVIVFDKNFSDFGDYENSGDITSGRKQAIETAIDKISEDILLSVVSNW